MTRCCRPLSLAVPWPSCRRRPGRPSAAGSTAQCDLSPVAPAGADSGSLGAWAGAARKPRAEAAHPSEQSLPPPHLRRVKGGDYFGGLCSPDEYPLGVGADRAVGSAAEECRVHGTQARPHGGRVGLQQPHAVCRRGGPGPQPGRRPRPRSGSRGAGCDTVAADTVSQRMGRTDSGKGPACCFRAAPRDLRCFPAVTLPCKPLTAP